MAEVWLGGAVVLMTLPRIHCAFQDCELYDELERMFREYANVEVALEGPYITGVYAVTIKYCELHTSDIVSKCKQAFECILGEHGEK